MNQSPAPWAVAQRSVGKRQATVVLDADRNEVCEVYDSAALIAAAPELLAALEALNAHGDWVGREWAVPAEVWRTARAAIAKATA